MYLGKRVSVIFPVYNEGENVRAAIEEFLRHPAVDEIIAVDNNSTDDSAQEIRRTSARYVSEEKQGYGAALRRGMREATGDLIVTVEPDGTFKADDLDRLLIFSRGYEAVFGTRTSRVPVWAGRDLKANMDFFIRLGNWAVAKLLEYLFNGPSFTDVGCTYKLIHRHAYERIRNSLTVDGNWFSPEFMIRVLQSGIPVVEIPVQYGARIGTSKITGKRNKAISLGLKMVGFILAERFHSMGRVRRFASSGILILLIATALFVGTRIPALSQPYHQDEYKWALETDPQWGLIGTLPHPPLTPFVYQYVGALSGYAHLRLIPITLSLFNLLLIFFLARRQFGADAAGIAAFLFSLDAFSILGSAQIDIDGAFLPFFTLALFYGYVVSSSGVKNRRRGFAIMAASLVLGLLTKLSFVLAPAAVAADALYRSPHLWRRFATRRIIVSAVVFMVLLAGVVAAAWEHILFLRYIGKFVAFSGRDYGEIFFLTAKSFIYLSPLIVLGIIAGLRYWRDLFLWYALLGFSLLFYFILFDFSHGAFDRYLLFLVAPGVVITAVTIEHLVLEVARRRQGAFWMVSLMSFALALLVGNWIFSRVHEVVPLIPKTAFVHAILHGQWNILLPLSGGSGPLGFYVPVDGVAFFWISSAFFAFAFLLARWFRRGGIASFALAVCIGFAASSNILVGTEYLTGRYYGYSPAVLATLVQRIDEMHINQPILTYNDIGAYELRVRHLYAARFYPHPQFIADNIAKFEAHRGPYLIVGIPAIDPGSGYARFFAQCLPLATTTNGLINGALLDCSHISPAIIAQ